MVMMDEGSSPNKLHWCQISVEQDLVNKIETMQELVVDHWSVI